jgi:putative heme transporter
MSRRGFRTRFTHRVHQDASGEGGAGTDVFEIESGELERVFVAPPWLRDAGLVAWLLVGIVLVVVGTVWLLALTSTIVIPVITATLLASVLSPLVGGMRRRGVPRAAGAAIVLLAVVVVGTGVLVMVLAGIASQGDEIAQRLSAATAKLADGLKSLGVDGHRADAARTDASSSVSSGGHLLLEGIAAGVAELAGLATFTAFTILSLFFLLKDGPTLRSWVERHSGVAPTVAHVVVGDMLTALRGYFTGVTIVAVFSAVIVGAGALIIGVPLVATIVIVTFVGGYIPYIGAWTAGAFAVLVALGDGGPSAALAMAIVALLANGALQQLVQPLAMGAALGLHPLAVLILTIGGGSLFGIIGLVLAAPIASAIVRISGDLGRARAAAAAAVEEEAAPPAAAPA